MWTRPRFIINAGLKEHVVEASSDDDAEDIQTSDDSHTMYLGSWSKLTAIYPSLEEDLMDDAHPDNKKIIADTVCAFLSFPWSLSQQCLHVSFLRQPRPPAKMTPTPSSRVFHTSIPSIPPSPSSPSGVEGTNTKEPVGSYALLIARGMN